MTTVEAGAARATGVRGGSPVSMWVIRNDAFPVSELIERGFVSVGWDDVGDLSQIGNDMAALRAALEANHPVAPATADDDPAAQGMATARAVADRLGLVIEENATWSGFGKKIPLVDGHTLYVNPSNSEVRATPEMVSNWVAEGLGVARGQGQYIRVPNPSASPGTYANWAGSLRRFAFDIQVGDIVIAPDSEERTVSFGRVAGPYEFRAEEATHRHRRRVEWMATGISRDDFSVSAQREIGAAITVFAVKRHAREFLERIRIATVTASASGFAGRGIADLVRQAATHGGSLFTPGAEIWTLAHTDELEHNYVDAVDASSASFDEKLDRQLEGVSDGALQLFAELWYLNLLPLADYTPATKRKLLASFLGRMAAPVSIPDNLDDALDTAVFAGGVAFKTRRWAQLALLVRVAAALLRLDEADRQPALGDARAFTDFLETVTDPNEPAQRQALKFMLFPDYYLPIVSQAHRKAIASAFSDRLGSHVGRDTDETLHLITEALRRELGAEPEYYAPPLLDQWDPDRIFVRSLGGVKDEAMRRAWLVRPTSHDQIHRWVTEDHVALDAKHLGAIDPGISRDELAAAVDAGYGHLSYAARTERTDDFQSFVNRVNAGDLVVAAISGILHFGDIEGAAQYVVPDDGTPELRRAVTWSATTVKIDSVPRNLAARLQAQHELLDLTGHLEVLEALKEGTPALRIESPGPLLALPEATDELAGSLLVSREWIQEVVELLRDRPQLIFFGPPGTGKTYLARKIAEHLAGDPSRVKLVQFHPAYSYEDFFEGYRPTDAGTFTLTSGPMRRIVDQARENPSTPHVLIIDEINRGNLAKVFGELYFLLEYREEAVDLMYGGDDKGFTLPANVFIFGTMNTADRSIALVDAAMRRRFSFLALHPSQEPTSGILRRWLTTRGLPPETADLLDELNHRIEDPDFKVGPSYFMRPAVHAAGGLERTWRTAILPLLEEHHFGDGTDVQARYGLADLRKAIGPAAEPVQPADPLLD